MVEKILDIGCGLHKVLPDAVGLDSVALPGIDVVHNLDNFPYPFDTATFDKVYAHMVLEHVTHFQETMEEIHRILKPGGLLLAKVPYYNSQTAFQDYTHKNFFTEKSFYYFTRENELSYYTNIRYEIVKQTLVSNSNSTMERLRNLIPLRSILKFVFNNMYDEIHIVLKKVL